MLRYREIIELRSIGLSQEKVAFFCGCSMAKVKQVFDRASALGLEWPVPIEFSEEEIRQLVDPPPAPVRHQPDCKAIFDAVCKEQNIGPKLTNRHRAKAWSEYLSMAEGSDVPPYSKESFEKIYAKWHKSRSGRAVMRVDWTPGEEIQVDWAGSTLTLHGADGTTTPAYLFVATSPYSYYTFVRASLDMGMQSWLEHHRHMFEFFGGVPLFLAPDNLATGITFKEHPGSWRERTVNKKYQELADYYGVLVAPTRVNTPTDKAAVESHVRHAAGRIMGILRQLRFTSIDQLNYAIEELLELFNAKVSEVMGRSRKEIFLEEEAGCLGPLPEKPFTSVTWSTCTASSDAVVCVRGVYYGIPERYANAKVAARISDDCVDVFTLNRRQLLAHHARHPDGSETFEGFAGRRPDRFKPLDEWASQNRRESMLEQWHPERNEGLEPSDVVCLSKKKVWWKCADCGYEWQETPLSRTSRDWDDCLACADVDLVPGRNDLATLFPDIAAEWHPSKNARPPFEVFPDHAVSAWWVGAECGHEWATPIFKRTSSAAGALCPYCSGEKVLLGFNDVATLCPDLAERWHPVKNRERTPENTPVCSTSKVYLWGGLLSDVSLKSPRAWLLENGYEEALEPFLNRVSEAKALDKAGEALSSTRKPMDEGKVEVKWIRYAYMWERGVSLEDWCERSCRFDILEEWDYRKNGKLTPRGVSRSSAQVVWWRCEHGHEWQASVSDRTVSNRGCSVCARVYRVIPGINDLASCKPALLKWYSPRNELTPDQVSDRSWMRTWWECPNCGFEWQRPVNRIPGETLTCPACDKWARRGKRGILVQGVNDLASKRPSVAAQWHPTKNGDLTPENVFWQSRKTAWWLGRCGHEWQAVVSRRTIAKAGCPYCSNKALLPGFNDLATVRPELAARWHPTRNQGLLPSEVVFGSGRKVWWLDECGHEWEAAPYRRAHGSGCPFCAGVRVLPGFNDLASQNPELAAQWHPTKNGDLSPDAVMIGSSRKVWWLGGCGHEWPAEVRHRAKGGQCPYCANKMVLRGFNDLSSQCPEVAARWHPDKNDKLKPKDVVFSSKQLVWWLGECGHEWEESIAKYSRTGDAKCPYCSGSEVLVGFNDLATTHPELASEWHPRMNKGLKPKDVTARSSEKVWWVCPNRHTWEESIRNRALHNYRCHYCSGRKVPERPLKLGLPSDIPDKQRIGISLEKWCENFDRSDLLRQWHSEKNGRLRPDDVLAQSHTVVWWRCDNGHEWAAAAKDRTAKKANCPFCSNQRVLAGINDLASRRPDIAAHWNSEKNGGLKPSEVVPGSTREVWWLGECGHEWKAAVFDMSAGHGCPYCAGKKVLPGFNDLASQYLEVAAQWHPEKNGTLKANAVSAHSNQNAWWLGECGHEWEAVINSRTTGGSGCPYCAGKKVLPGFNDLITTHPRIAAEWHPSKNGDLTPDVVIAGSHRKAWWLGTCGHEWKTAVSTRCLQGTNCPYCAGKKVLKGYNDLATVHPDLAAEWHPEKNGELKPDELSAGTHKRAWWLGRCGHEWEAPVSRRTLRGTGCPYCAGRKVFNGFNDLATTHPKLAAEWHPEKNGDLTPNDVTAGADRKVWWQCVLGHEWEARVHSRKKGAGCPYCYREWRQGSRKG